jgi:hypothetical protein
VHSYYAIVMPWYPLPCQPKTQYKSPHNPMMLQVLHIFLPSFTSLKDVRSVVGCKDGSCRGYSSKRKRLHAPHVGIPNNFVRQTYCTTSSTSIILFSQIFKFSEFSFNKYIWGGKLKNLMRHFRIFRPLYPAITLINKQKIKTESLSYWTLKILVPSMISSYFT